MSNSTAELSKMKEKFEKFVTDAEMGMKVELFTLEHFKEWIQDLEEVCDNGFSYEDGIRDGREEVRDAFARKLRDVSTDLDDLKEKLNDLEADASLDPTESSDQ